MNPLIIDTHLHIWDLTKVEYKWLEADNSILNRSYMLSEILPEAKSAGIEGAILVQAANNMDDTALMLEHARKNNWIKGVVGWLPLMQPDQVHQLLKAWDKERLLKGVRHLIHNEPDPNWLLQLPVLKSLQLIADAGLCFDLVGITNTHLGAALKVLGKIPQLKLVIDHLNQPPLIDDALQQEWKQLIRLMADYPFVYAKISGLGTVVGTLDVDWLNKISGVVQYCMDCFGAPRCMLGGDWPVALLAGSYQKHWTLYRQLVEKTVPSNEQHYLWRTTAAECYQLN